MAGRPLAKATGIGKGVAQGLAGFMNFKAAFEDAVRKHQWEKERNAEEDKLKRQTLAVGAGYQPQDMGKFLASGEGGDWGYKPKTTLRSAGGGLYSMTEEGGNVEQVIAPTISSADEFRGVLEDASNRIMNGENANEIIDELVQHYPSQINADTLYNLKNIVAPSAKKKILGLKNQAIKALKEAGYPTTPSNIESAIKQLREQ